MCPKMCESGWASESDSGIDKKNGTSSMSLSLHVLGKGLKWEGSMLVHQHVSLCMCWVGGLSGKEADLCLRFGT